MALKISDEAKVQMPMKTVASLIALVAIGTWAYFGIIETQNKALNRLELMEKDLVENTAFRIGWPVVLLDPYPADSEQFMLIEELYKQVEKLQLQQEAGIHNEVMIKFLEKAVNKLQNDVEKLKDKQRDFTNGTVVH